MRTVWRAAGGICFQPFWTIYNWRGWGWNRGEFRIHCLNRSSSLPVCITSWNIVAFTSPRSVPRCAKANHPSSCSWQVKGLRITWSYWSSTKKPLPNMLNPYCGWQCVMVFFGQALIVLCSEGATRRPLCTKIVAGRIRTIHRETSRAFLRRTKGKKNKACCASVRS